ncbi:MAG TPA: class I SAM-dependent methyltransferase [Candidatus Solibacter sp.]|nr:class I SAM-dependent methyltransferase [Candidatus Solibacter sp.]
MQPESRRTYLPAAGYHWSLPFYDPIVKLLGGEKARGVLIDQAALQPGHRVLDIGCGTGTMAVLVKRQHPDVEIIGIDPDPKALSRARRKAARAGVSIQFDQGFGDELPYPESSFDRVFSSFMFHHLPAEEKGKTLRAVRRVLKPGGRFHMLDFERPEAGVHGFLARLFHASERMKDNSESRVLSLIKEAGFGDPRKVGERTMFSGQIAYFQAVA